MRARGRNRGTGSGKWIARARRRARCSEREVHRRRIELVLLERTARSRDIERVVPQRPDGEETRNLARLLRDAGADLQLLPRVRVTEAAQVIAIDHVERAVLAAGDGDVSDGAAGRQIAEHRRATGAEVLVVLILIQLVRGAEVLLDRETRRQLQERVAVVIRRCGRVRDIEVAVAGRHVEQVVRVGCWRSAAHPDAALACVGRRVQHGGSRE